jgi:uncharacterized membrane protein
MDAWPLLGLLLVGTIIAVPIWLIVRVVGAQGRIDELSQRVRKLESEVYRTKREAPSTIASTLEAVHPKPTAPPRPFINPFPPVTAPKIVVAPPPPLASMETPSGIPAPAPVMPSAAPPNPKPKPAAAAINWEQFMGVKGFAWVGGLALFLGVAFFIKYSFDNNLVAPELRMTLGFLAGLGLVAGGVVMSRKNFPALSQTLCATGVVVLYAVTFGCHALYHFKFFGPLPTFLLMALITVAAFLLAARMDALVVAILGMLGGFLTPVLLSTGEDNPLGLFGYIAILDTGLMLVALNRRWHFLAALAAAGTIFMEFGWADKFFESEKYFADNKILVALGVLAGFNILYLAANVLAKRRTQSNWWFAGGNLGLAAAAFAFTAFFFTFPPLAQRPVLLFSFVFLIDLVVAGLVWLEAGASVAQPAAGLAVFALMAIWTLGHLTNELLNAALAFYLIFALFHSALPAWLQKRGGHGPGVAARLNHCFPPLALLLVLAPIFQLQELSFLVWPFVLLVDLLAIVLAVLTATLLPVLAVLVLTLAATGAMIFKIPADFTGLPESFFLLGGFAVFFAAASVWLVRRFKPDVFTTGLDISGDVKTPESIAALLPMSSVVLPFLLLVMVTLRLPLANPSPVFGLALLLVVMLLGLTRMFALYWMPIAGLASTFAVECAWHFNRFDLSGPNHVAPAVLLAWYLIFFGVFAVFPFVFFNKFAKASTPWAAAALAGPAQFLLVHQLVKAAWPNGAMGLLPAGFAIPGLLSLAVVAKRIPAANPARMAQLAWFGGVALFFTTLVFPVQFDHEWITIGWALEGAALLWLFHRVPHPGLRLTGLGLLFTAFVRLAFNPAVLDYHTRSATPIFNWYLYSYGIVTIALFAGTRLLAPPRHTVFQANMQAVLGSLGTVLGFLLLNIEIADYFSAPGSTLTFEFSGSFARDMTYSIAWALFALALLVYGILKKIPLARYAAMALLCVTLLKLFFHDLASLGQLYRIGAFVGVAIIAMVASFAYQKFFSAAERPAEAKSENTP